MKVHAPVLEERADKEGMVEVNLGGDYTSCIVCGTHFNEEYTGKGIYIHPVRGYAICSTNGKKPTCLEKQELDGGIRRGHIHIDEKAMFQIVVEQRELEKSRTKSIEDDIV